MEHKVLVPTTVLPEESVLSPSTVLVEESLGGEQSIGAQAMDDAEMVEHVKASRVEVLTPGAPEGPATPPPYSTFEAPHDYPETSTPEQWPRPTSSSKVPRSIAAKKMHYIEVCFR
ncbi:hypothetical protein Nepgr_021073 [Nepenthes gracilis]|uniref:Uncharacterized protein n=1 Tax=Nepenthes gracilis TaxID=150966 RepID=A0AAD3SZ52_NEPGR|nr:hypothetical protein Nepgr_021073 [Nepenthes gracilis]